MAIFDENSFLMGVQVGRRLKAWDAARTRPAEDLTREAIVLRTGTETAEDREEEQENGG